MGYRSVMLGIATIAMGVFAMGCCMKPRVRIECSRDDDGRLLVNMKPSYRVNGLYNTVLWLHRDDGFLWALEFAEPDSASEWRIVYGEVPSGSVQKYPARDGHPKNIPLDGVLYISVDYQYDTLFPPAACIGTSCSKFQFSKGHGIKPLGKASPGEGLQHPVPGGKVIFGPGYGGADFVDPLFDPDENN